MWAQYDFGDWSGRHGHDDLVLPVAGLVRFRVVLPLLDKSGPSVWVSADLQDLRWRTAAEWAW